MVGLDLVKTLDQLACHGGGKGSTVLSRVIKPMCLVIPVADMNAACEPRASNDFKPKLHATTACRN